MFERHFCSVYLVAPRLHTDHEVLVLAYDPKRRRWFVTADLGLGRDLAAHEGETFALEFRTHLNEDGHWLGLESPASRYWQPVNTLR